MITWVLLTNQRVAVFWWWPIISGLLYVLVCTISLLLLQVHEEVKRRRNSAKQSALRTLTIQHKYQRCHPEIFTISVCDNFIMYADHIHRIVHGSVAAWPFTIWWCRLLCSNRYMYIYYLLYIHLRRWVDSKKLIACRVVWIIGKLNAVTI